MKKRNTKKIIRNIGILIIVLGILVYMDYMIMNQKKVKTYKVEVSGVEITSSLDSQYNVNGTLMLHNGNISAVSMEFNAKIIEIFVENGNEVEVGQELFKVKKLSDNTDVSVVADRAGVVEFVKQLYVGNIIPQYTTVMTINNLTCANDFYIKTKLSASQYNNLSSISSIKITFGNSISNIVLNGSLEDKCPDVIEENNNESYYIYIQVQDSDFQLQTYKLVNGMSVNLAITTTVQLGTNAADEEVSYYKIPFSSIVSRDNKNVIFLYERIGSDYYARMVMVDVLSNNGTTAIVKSTSDKLNSKTGIITAGNYKLNGSEKVSIGSGK